MIMDIDGTSMLICICRAGIHPSQKCMPSVYKLWRLAKRSYTHGVPNHGHPLRPPNTLCVTGGPQVHLNTWASHACGSRQQWRQVLPLHIFLNREQL